MKQNVLVVCAHADDEALGCGGTLAQHVKDGDTVTALFMTDGVGARGEANAQIVQERAAARDRAAEIIGISRVISCSFPDNQMDTVPLLDVVRVVEALIEELQPEIIYTHCGGDLNVDHQVAFRAVMTACRPQPGAPVREIYCFETLSSSEWSIEAIPFAPNVFVDIEDTLPQKIKALNAYHLEMRDFPHTRSLQSVEALVRSRGTSVGMAAAEAFQLVRLLR